jgi:hypothetical protein
MNLMPSCVTSAAAMRKPQNQTRQNMRYAALVRSSGLALLYVGISPKPPSAVGTPSRQTLRSRLRYHFRGNAEGSTLRLSLGCLFSHLMLQPYQSDQG